MDWAWQCAAGSWHDSGTDRQRAVNEQLEAEVARLQSEVADLKEGLGTVEEKARYELGMVKPNEVFVQIAH